MIERDKAAKDGREAPRIDKNADGETKTIGDGARKGRWSDLLPRRGVKGLKKGEKKLRVTNR